MEDEEEIVVVIVGDDDVETNSNACQAEVEVKKEVFERNEELSEVEDLIQLATKHGEVLELDLDCEVKKEFIECLENEFLDPDDPDYIPDEHIREEYLEKFSDEFIGPDDPDFIPEESNEDREQEQSDSEDETMPKVRGRLRTSTHAKSFINELRLEYPELRTDAKLLVNTLTEIMRTIKPPPPPRDYFIMNNIMFECVKCGKLTESMPAAGRHYQERHGKRYLMCFACGDDFRSTTNLYKHEKRCAAPDSTIMLKARAQFLGRKGRSRPYLLKPSEVPRLQVVRRKSPAPTKFSCTLCPAEFSTKKSLESHQNMHEGLRPFRCKECPAAYTSNASLFKHSKKHSDDQFICDHCNRCFKSKTPLITHMNTHKPLRKFPCTVCGLRFAQNAARRLHEDRTHYHLPPPCACQICPKRYPRMSLLNAHMQRAHGMSLMTRAMFFKRLSLLPEREVKKATIVLKTDNPIFFTNNQENFNIPLEYDNDTNLREEVQTEQIEMQQVEEQVEESDEMEEKIVEIEINSKFLTNEVIIGNVQEVETESEVKTAPNEQIDNPVNKRRNSEMLTVYKEMTSKSNKPVPHSVNDNPNKCKRRDKNSKKIDKYHKEEKAKDKSEDKNTNIDNTEERVTVIRCNDDRSFPYELESPVKDSASAAAVLRNIREVNPKNKDNIVKSTGPRLRDRKNIKAPSMPSL